MKFFIVTSTGIAALFGASVLTVALAASAFLASLHADHRRDAERFAAMHPGHELTLDPLQSTAYALLTSSAAYGIGILGHIYLPALA